MFFRKLQADKFKAVDSERSVDKQDVAEFSSSTKILQKNKVKVSKSLVKRSKKNQKPKTKAQWLTSIVIALVMLVMALATQCYLKNMNPFLSRLNSFKKFWSPEPTPTHEVKPKPAGLEEILKNFILPILVSMIMVLFLGLQYLLYQPKGYNFYREKYVLSAITVFGISTFGKHSIVENVLKMFPSTTSKPVIVIPDPQTVSLKMGLKYFGLVHLILATLITLALYIRNIPAKHGHMDLKKFTGILSALVFIAMAGHAILTSQIEKPVAEIAKPPVVNEDSMQTALKYYELFQMAFVLVCVIGSLVHVTATRYSSKLTLRQKVFCTLVMAAMVIGLYYGLTLQNSDEDPVDAVNIVLNIQDSKKTTRPAEVNYYKLFQFVYILLFCVGYYVCGKPIGYQFKREKHLLYAVVVAIMVLFCISKIYPQEMDSNAQPISSVSSSTDIGTNWFSIFQTLFVVFLGFGSLLIKIESLTYNGRRRR